MLDVAHPESRAAPGEAARSTTSGKKPKVIEIVIMFQEQFLDLGNYRCNYSNDAL